MLKGFFGVDKARQRQREAQEAFGGRALRFPGFDLDVAKLKAAQPGARAMDGFPAPILDPAELREKNRLAAAAKARARLGIKE